MNGQKPIRELSDQVLRIFVVVFLAVGIVAGMIGLGAGLVFLTVQQAIGVGLLSASLGAVLGWCLIGGRMLRSVVAATREVVAEPKPKQTDPFKTEPEELKDG